MYSRRPHLFGDGIEEGRDNALCKAPLLILIHLHDLSPVCGNLGQVQRLAEVNKVEDILLETRATKPNGGLQELRANTRVEPDGVRYLIDVGTSCLADSGESVDRGDTLSKHSVGGELGQFRRPRPTVRMRSRLQGTP